MRERAHEQCLGDAGTPSMSAWLPVKIAMRARSDHFVLADDDFAGFVPRQCEDFFESVMS